MVELNLFLVSLWAIISGIIAMFVLWRKLRRERVEHEEEFVDQVLIASLVSLIVGRAGYILTHFPNFGLQVSLWLSFWIRPGSIEILSLLSFFLVLWKLTEKKDWRDVGELLDYTSISSASFFFVFSLVHVVVSVVSLVIAWQSPTSLHVLTFSSVLPIIALIIQSVLYGGLFTYLSRVEKVYRTFSWYRAKRRSAQTGFIVAMLFIGYGAIGFGLSWFLPMNLLIGRVPLDPFFSLLVMMIGFVILYVRSGRTLFNR
jgi:prolipoprotein diacylglyceryltransferase